MKEKIVKVVIEVVQDVVESIGGIDSSGEIGAKTKLYGSSGIFDSLSLVSLIADIEERISEEFDKDIILADEKAMSQKTSPFRNVETLTAYIEKLLLEQD